MDNPMRERIQERLDLLGISAIEAAKRVPSLNRYFIYDFMNHKKASIPNKRIEEVARALSCNPAYLLGTSPSSVPVLNTVKLSGVIEPGTWRSKQPELNEKSRVYADPAHAPEDQLGFLCRSDEFEKLGIPNGSIVLVVTNVAPRRNDIVVTKHSRESSDGTEIEHMISMTKINSNHQLVELDRGDAEILGVVIQAVINF